MESVKSRDIPKRQIKSAQIPYISPQYSLITSLDSPISALKPSEKSLIEEETTCLTKLAYTTSQYTLDLEPKVKLSTSHSSNLQVLSKVLKMKIQVKILQNGLSQNKESLSILDSENLKLGLYKDQLHQKLKKKFELSRKQKKNFFNCCFF